MVNNFAFEFKLAQNIYIFDAGHLINFMEV